MHADLPGLHYIEQDLGVLKGKAEHSESHQSHPHGSRLQAAPQSSQAPVEGSQSMYLNATHATDSHSHNKCHSTAKAQLKMYLVEFSVKQNQKHVFVMQ